MKLRHNRKARGGTARAFSASKRIGINWTAVNQAEQDGAGLARLSATVDPVVLQTAKSFAGATGFRNSFSAYLNDVLDRDNKQRSALLNARPVPAII